METVNVASVEKATGARGNTYLKLTLADDSTLFVWDTKLFGSLENAGGGVAKLDVDRTRQYPRVITVHSVEHGVAPSNSAVPGQSSRDEQIRRQAALNAAVEAAGICPSLSPEAIKPYLVNVGLLADGMLEWLEGLPF